VLPPSHEIRLTDANGDVCFGCSTPFDSSRPVHRTRHVHRIRRGTAHVVTLSVTCVLGLCVSTLLPEFAGSSGDPRRAALEDDLESLRTAIEMYRHEHRGAWPAAGTTDATAFEAALLEPSIVGGRTCGPYVVDRLPDNPFNGLRTVRVVAAGPRPPADGSTGWTYDATTGSITANTPGRDAEGRVIAER
jgi:hypothetical protein